VLKDRKSPLKGSRPSVPHGTNFLNVLTRLISFFSVLWHCWLSNWKGIRPVITEHWYSDGGGGDLTSFLPVFKRVLVVAIASVNISCYTTKSRRFDILVLAYPGCPWNWPLKRVLLTGLINFYIPNNYTQYLTKISPFVFLTTCWKPPSFNSFRYTTFSVNLTVKGCKFSRITSKLLPHHQ